MIKEAVEAEIVESLNAMKSRFLGVTKRKKRTFETWMWIERQWTQNRLSGKVDIPRPCVTYRCMISTCEGGAWSYFGSFQVLEDKISVQLKTVNGIMRCRSEYHELGFEYNNPSFPDNLIRTIEQHAIACNICFRLKHDRNCRRWCRETRR